MHAREVAVGARSLTVFPWFPISSPSSAVPSWALVGPPLAFVGAHWLPSTLHRPFVGLRWASLDFVGLLWVFVRPMLGLGPSLASLAYVRPIVGLRWLSWVSLLVVGHDGLRLGFVGLRWASLLKTGCI